MESTLVLCHDRRVIPASDKFQHLLQNPPDLPIVAGLSQVVEALSEAGAAVISAPPGSGKTTLVPAVAATLSAPQRVLVVQPRRIAARSAARHLAALLNEPLGRTVGYTVRGDSTVCATTRVEMVTPGVLLNRLHRDPELSGVGAVIIDEIHERHMDSDVAFTFLTEVRAALREDLIVVAMSATIMAEAVSEVLATSGPVRTVEIPGKIFPLSIRYIPPPRGVRPLTTSNNSGRISVSREFLSHVSDTTTAALSATKGDVLVFVPGVGDIDTVVADLRQRHCDMTVLPLHGALTSSEQDRIYQQDQSRRIIVSSALAESSLTVPGVRVVVDACLSREPRLDLNRNSTSLVTVRASQASSVQRAGRAGREAPGVVYRCISEGEWAALRPFAQPAIATSDLTGLALQCAAWGAPDPADLNWLTPPPVVPYTQAMRTLHLLGAVSEHKITAVGRYLNTLPLEPRWGFALLSCSPLLGDRLTSEAVAVIDSQMRAPGGDGVALWKQLAEQRCARHLHQQWKRQAQRLESLLRERTTDSLPLSSLSSVNASAVSFSRDEALAMVIAHAYPDRIAKARQPHSRNYVMAGGIGAQLPAGSALIGQPWLAVADTLHLQGQKDAIISVAAPISAEEALTIGKELVSEDVTAHVHSDGAVTVRSQRKLGAIVLAEHNLSRPDKSLVQQAITEWVKEQGVTALEWEADALQLRERMQFLHEHMGQPWPAVDDNTLVEHRDMWLSSSIASAVKHCYLPRVNASDLRMLLPWPEASRLDELAPAHITIPTGRQVRVDYSGPHPTVRMRVQECFGWVRTPTVADGRVGLTIELLSPAQRPVAVTNDLTSFWTGAYEQVRAEMRGRYPKHPWPEDPIHAAPTTRTKRNS